MLWTEHPVASCMHGCEGYVDGPFGKPIIGKARSKSTKQFFNGGMKSIQTAINKLLTPPQVTRRGRHTTNGTFPGITFYCHKCSQNSIVVCQTPKSDPKWRKDHANHVIYLVREAKRMYNFDALEKVEVKAMVLRGPTTHTDALRRAWQDPAAR
jgi:hypothetical protein